MTDYDKLTVVKLREELVNRGLPKTGLKAVLVQRLIDADAQSEHQAPKSEQERNPSPPVLQPQTNDLTTAFKDEPETSKAQSQIHYEASNDASRRSLPIHVGQEEKTAEVTTQLPNGASADEIAATTHEVAPSQTLIPPEAEHSKPKEEDLVNTHQETERGNVTYDKVSDTITENAGGKSSQEQNTPTTAVESPSMSSTIPPMSTQTSILGGEEMREDTNKRKRRSQTPPPSSIETAQKRAKADDGRPFVKLPEDDTSMVVSPMKPSPDREDVPMVDGPASAVAKRSIEESETNGETRTDTSVSSADRPIAGDGDVDSAALTSAPQDDIVDEQQSPLRGTETSPAHEAPAAASPKQSPSDTRFRHLFPPKRETSPDRHKLNQDSEDRIIGPALHPATSALYIRDFMRPIKPDVLREYLSLLASPPDTDPNPEIITEFYLDNVKTHCLVTFANISAAARVRSGLHDRVWPNEKNRKPLWVDFVPETKISKWIEVETEAASDRRQGMKKWEVVYEEEEGGVMAYLQEAGPNSSAARNVQPMKPRKGSMTTTHGTPSAPKAREDVAAMVPPPIPAAKSDAGQGFQALDELFKVTAAKPKLYYLPVSSDTVDRRMDKLNAGQGGGRSDEKRRYTFEEGILVDKGPEFGFGRRGGYSGRGSGGYGGYQGRGGGYRGDNWRGRR